MESRSLWQQALLLLSTFLLFHGGQALPRRPKHHVFREKQWFKFVTRPDIIAPKWNINVKDEKAVSPGYWFIAPYAMLHQKQQGEPWVGPYIYDGKGELVWSGIPTFERYNIFDFRVQDVGGQNMITVIKKSEDAGLIYDNSYHLYKRVDWPGFYNTSNMHDFTITGNGTRALVMTKAHFNASQELLRPVGFNGSYCDVNGNGLKELDITGPEPKTIFTWNATDHIGLDETTFPRVNPTHACEGGWDIHHMNAIDQFPDGDYLVSSRHTDTIYKISHNNGSIVWRLGGVKSDFTFLGNSRFSRQHHARVREQNETHTTVSLFDNARGDGKLEEPSNDHSRGLVLLLDHGEKTAEILHEYAHPHDKLVSSRGSNQILPNGNEFIGWTFGTLISEHTSDGRLVLEAVLKAHKSTYRSYKFPWVGRPSDPPDVFSASTGSLTNATTEVYVSWNGATEVFSWNLYATDETGEGERLVASTEKKGFETAMVYNGFAPYVVVEGLDHAGNSLGRSNIAQTVPPNVQNTKAWLSSHPTIDWSWAEPDEKNQTIHTNSTGAINAPPATSPVTEDEASPISSPTSPSPDHTTASQASHAQSTQTPEHSLTEHAITVLTNPVSMFIAGFVCCAVIGAVFWAVITRSKRISWWRAQASGYTSLEHKNREAELEDEIEGRSGT